LGRETKETEGEQGRHSDTTGPGRRRRGESHWRKEGKMAAEVSGSAGNLRKTFFCSEYSPAARVNEGLSKFTRKACQKIRRPPRVGKGLGASQGRKGTAEKDLREGDEHSAEPLNSSRVG